MRAGPPGLQHDRNVADHDQGVERSNLRARPRMRPALARLGLALFASQCALVELLLRGVRAWHDPGALLSTLASVALWAALGSLAGRLVVRVPLALSAATLLIAQVVFFRHYHSAIADDAVAAALAMWSDVGPVLRQLAPRAALVILLAALLDGLLLAGRPAKLTRRQGLGLLAALALVALTVALGRAPWEVRAVAALRLLVHAPSVEHRPRALDRRPELPRFESSRARLPSVLVILDESVRASDYRLRELENAHPAWRGLERIELPQMRSLASYTRISLQSLLSGAMPFGSRESVLATPLLFDHLRAMRGGPGRPRLLYWSVQAPSVFERDDARDMADSVAFVEDVLAWNPGSTEDAVERGADARLAEWVARKLPDQPRPLLLFAHLVDTHTPYHVEEGVTPFLPYAHSALWSNLEPLHNAYRNAIVAQDLSVQAIVRSFLEVVGAEPYFILFTSDHGESFGEHDAIYHGQNLYDEQIHVPAWIAFGNGALSVEQAGWLRAHAGDFLTHLDVLPTLLDLYGVLDAFPLLGVRKGLAGRSLLARFADPPAVLTVSNCTAMFPCPVRTYGVLKQGIALLAQPWDEAWHCLELDAGNRPLALDTPACVELRQASQRRFPDLPNGNPNR